MERVSVRAWLMFALVICAALLAFLVLPTLPHSTRYVAGLLVLIGIMSVVVSDRRSHDRQQAASSNPGNDLAAAGTGEGNPSKTRYLLISLELVFLVLLVYVFRFLFPTLLGSTQAHRFMADLINADTYGKFLVGTIIIGAYIAVTVYGTRSWGTRARLWMISVAIGGITGLAAALLTLAIGLGAQFLVMLSIATLVGLIAGKLTGQTEAGVLGGFWCGLTSALVWAIAGMVVDLALASQLANTAWASSHYFCQGLAGTELAACTVGSDMSNFGKVLLGLPILSGGLGVIGGLWGTALTKTRRPMESAWGRALVAPIVFCGVMILLLVSQMFGLLR